ncbi:MAG: hypothetical protein JNL43_03855 [Flavobacteriales bacterium]|nr:hypothetical protein [Flavobacteriales bacterium]
MKTLFLAWQDKRPVAQGGTRRWYPIGRLQNDVRAHLFHFDYTKGMMMAREQAGFRALDAFPQVDKHYVSSELFPLFQNRLMRREREDFPAFVERLGLDPDQFDPFEILSITGGERQTDPLEVFPKIEKRADDSFVCRFFIHGWRYVNKDAQQRMLTLLPGEPLQVTLEMNNPTGPAIQLETALDYYMLGWAPRYLVMDLIKSIGEGYADLKAHVVRVNPAPAPYNQRVLVELEGRYPAGLEPMSAEQFQPVLAEA